MTPAGPSGRPAGLRIAALSIACAAGISVCQVASQPAPREPARSQKLARDLKSDGRDFYVSPQGTASGSGTSSSPWDLATALAQPASVHPGDTIWLRGGTYTGTFTSGLTGTATAPIKVRQFPGERATLDGGTTPPSYQAEILRINGAYAWYVGFEVTNSDPVRTSSSAGSNPPDQRAVGVAVYGPGCKIINMVIHDTGQGVGLWTPATNSEVYGSLIYYNGWDAPDRGHGHGIYTQNQAPSTKRIADNILFEQFAIGIQAYTEAGNIDNIALEGNTAFDNGGLSQVSGYTYNVLVGGLRVANAPSWISNATFTSVAAGGNNNLGYSAGCVNATVSGNTFVGSTAFKLVNCSSGLSLDGNTFYGELSGLTASQYPDNTYLSVRPSSPQVFVRPNQYEPGRASITVFNWANQDSVDIDASSLLKAGDRYEIRNAQNVFSPPLSSATYTGGAIPIPLTGLAPALPVGAGLPSTPSREVGVFLLERTLPPRMKPAPPPETGPRTPRTVSPRSVR